MLREQQKDSPQIDPDTSRQSAIGELWIELGRLIERFNDTGGQDNNTARFVGILTVREQP